MLYLCHRNIRDYAASFAQAAAEDFTDYSACLVGAQAAIVGPHTIWCTLILSAPVSTMCMKVAGLTKAAVRQHLIASNKCFGIADPERLLNPVE